MAKTFNELKSGDKIYYFNIFNTYTGTKKGNCKEAYKIVNNTISLEAYPDTSGICELEIDEIVEINGFDNKCRLHTTAIPSMFDVLGTNTCDVSSSAFNDCVYVVATTREEATKKAIEITHALIEVANNTRIQKTICYKNILKKIES